MADHCMPLAVETDDLKENGSRYCECFCLDNYSIRCGDSRGSYLGNSVVFHCMPTQDLMDVATLHCTCAECSDGGVSLERGSHVRTSEGL